MGNIKGFQLNCFKKRVGEDNSRSYIRDETDSSHGDQWTILHVSAIKYSIWLRGTDIHKG